MAFSPLFRRFRSACLAGAFLAAASSGAASAADKFTVLLDWFVNPDHGPLFVAQERGYFRAAALDVTLIAPSDPNDPPRLVAGQARRCRDFLPAAAPYPDQQGVAVDPDRHAGRNAAEFAGRVARRPGQADRRPQGQEGRLFGRRIRDCAAHGDAGQARPDHEGHHAGQCELRPVGEPDVGQGRRRHRRLPEFPNSTTWIWRSGRGAPSSSRKRVCRPTTNWFTSPTGIASKIQKCAVLSTR